MITAIRSTTRRELPVDADAGAAGTRLPHRAVAPPPTRRQELRRAAAVQAAWLADLR